MVRRAIRFMDGVSSAVGHLMGWLIVALMALILVEVVTRYVMQSPLAVADEMGGYVLVAITFIGLGYTFKEKGHVRVELLVNRLSGPSRRWLRVLTVILATGFAAVMLVASYQLVSYSILFGSRSGSWLRIPLKWPQMSLIVGSALLLLQLLAEVAKAVLAAKGGEEDG